MRKMLLSGVSIAALLTTATPSAMAQSVSLIPRGSYPAFSSNGINLTATGRLAGIKANFPTTVSLVAQGHVTAATCTYPDGSQETISLDRLIGAGNEVPISPSKGGWSFSVTTNAQVGPYNGATDCRFGEGTEVYTAITYDDLTNFSVRQNGQILLNLFCYFSPPVTGGSVPPQDVSCHQ